MRVLETFWSGRHFRSRTEARWAVAFEAMGLPYDYEKQGFELDSGVWYLPDFWLPTILGGAWAEVKGRSFTDDEDEKVRLLAAGTGRPVLYLENEPHCHKVRVCGGPSITILNQAAVYRALSERFARPIKSDPPQRANRLRHIPGPVSKSAILDELAKIEERLKSGRSRDPQ